MRTLILLLILSSCSTETKLEKPFVIINKYTDNWYGKGDTQYQFQDSKGNIRYFRDNVSKYNIGDTIK